MKAFTCVELFAGDGNVGRSMRYGMVATAQLELEYGKQVKVHKHNAFDMTTPAGFAWHSCKESTCEKGNFIISYMQLQFHCE